MCKHNPTRLIKPLINYDTAAIALSFVPAGNNNNYDKGYTYQHLRRDIFDKIQSVGVDVGSRYALPSAHITIARFVADRNPFLQPGEKDKGMDDHVRVVDFVNTLDALNLMLKHEYWPDDGNENAHLSEGGWCLGQEGFLELVDGASWYGRGERIV